MRAFAVAAVALVAGTVPAHAELSRVNLRGRPIALLAGIPGAELQVGLASFLAAGTSLQYFSSDVGSTSFHVYEITASLAFFLNGERFTSSWFLEPKGAYLPLSVDGMKSHCWTISVLGGRTWRWPAGFNASIGAGLAFFSSSASLMVAPATGLLEIADAGARAKVEPVLELTAGWAF